MQVAVSEVTAPSTLLNEGGVSISAGVVVIGGKTFIAKNITSVRAAYGRKPSTPVGVVFFVIAVALFVTLHPIIGGIAFFLALGSQTKVPSKLFITTAGGESMALEHKDADFVRRVHDATVSVSSQP